MTTDLCFECSNKDSILCSICGIAKDGAREHFNQKPITNADRIRAMSDEELAVWIAETSNCSDWCKLNERCSAKPEYECCVNVWLSWLREECKSED